MAEASTNTGASHQAPESSKDMAGNCLPSIPSEGKVLIPHHLAPTLSAATPVHPPTCQVHPPSSFSLRGL